MISMIRILNCEVVLKEGFGAQDGCGSDDVVDVQKEVGEPSCKVG